MKIIADGRPVRQKLSHSHIAAAAWMLRLKGVLEVAVIYTFAWTTWAAAMASSKSFIAS